MACLATRHMNLLVQHKDYLTIIKNVGPLFEQAMALAATKNESHDFGIQTMLGMVLELLSSAYWQGNEAMSS